MQSKVVMVSFHHIIQNDRENFGNTNTQIQHLIDSGLDPNAPDEAGDTPLISALKNYSHTSRTVIDFLLRQDTVDVDRVNAEGKTPLQITVSNFLLYSFIKRRRYESTIDDLGLIEAFLQKGANPNRTPVHLNPPKSTFIQCNTKKPNRLDETFIALPS